MEQRIHQRRALYTVLQKWLDEEKLVQALLLFEEHHQGKPSIAIHEYLTRIAPLFEHKVDTKQVRRNLMEVLVRGGSQDLAPDPKPLLERYKANNTIEQSDIFKTQPAPEQLALHRLISGLMRATASAQRKQLHTHIARQLKSRFVNGNYDLLAQYLLSDNPQYLSRFDDNALRDFLSLIYVASCEVLGPVMADQWFGGAIAQVRHADTSAGNALNRYL
jgi:hypothetical protein